MVCTYICMPCIMQLPILALLWAPVIGHKCIRSFIYTTCSRARVCVFVFKCIAKLPAGPPMNNACDCNKSTRDSSITFAELI